MMNVLMGIKLNSDFIVRQYKLLLVSAALPKLCTFPGTSGFQR